MKLSNKQKLSIWKSLKLNEDFFDDNQLDIYDETGFDLENGYVQQYTYHFQFIFHLYPFIKNNYRMYCVYYFEEPEYKQIIESGFLSIKKSLEFILQATPIVTDYSEPKFCTLSEKFISIFPFMNNKPEKQLFIVNDEDKIGTKAYKEIFSRSISLEMTLNLSDKKNRANIEKLLYSFYRLSLIYNKLIKKINTYVKSIIPVTFGYFRNNPFVKMDLIELISPTDGFKRYSPYMIDILLTNLEELKKLHGKGKTGFQLSLKR